MGAGLHINHVPGFLGAKRSLTGSSEQRVRARRYLGTSSLPMLWSQVGHLYPRSRRSLTFSLKNSPFCGLEEKHASGEVWRAGGGGGGGGGGVCSLGTAAGKKTVGIRSQRATTELFAWRDRVDRHRQAVNVARRDRKKWPRKFNFVQNERCCISLCFLIWWSRNVISFLLGGVAFLCYKLKVFWGLLLLWDCSLGIYQCLEAGSAGSF